ncbi:MAG: RIP metalloprotease RseP [Candidatus Omnitrophica bacterium]|nr:RIP metalloprotease RseP [Candidatus Omnitrophota bacterium]MBU1127678.1 RIP metalloprotease RseP [Candidatus Omnitrophota bacterium]MBU1784701.1 RIP metalloprotease RseP [Candidatus Omnitrophota bacterium]MBU1851467.1 RIP metalloprotease RseP [Candidatus Omnitrophota bacterium]
MLTGIIVFVVFGVLILIHEAGHLFAAKKAGITVEAFSLGMGKRLFGIKIKETDYRVSLIPFGGYCKMAGQDPGEAQGKPNEIGSKPIGHRFWVMAAGSITNYIFAFFLFSIVFMIGVPTLSNTVGQVLNGYPAKEAGMREGDEIIAINGLKVTDWEDILDAIKKGSSEGALLRIDIKRENRPMSFTVEPDISRVTNVFGQTLFRPMIGIAPANKVLAVSYGPLSAVYNGGKKLLQLTGMTYRMMWLLITGGMPIKGSLSGPIGIAYFIKQAAGMGIVPLLVIMAHISMALAIFNLLPLPVLDGGHIVFLFIEKLRSRPLSTRTQEVITNAAFVLLISFAIFVSWQDVIRFTPFGKKINPTDTVTIEKSR